MGLPEAIWDLSPRGSSVSAFAYGFEMRKLLKYTMLWHRFLGIGTCLFFGLWFASGIVMMYARMPELQEADRLNHLPHLNLILLHLSPQQALGLEVPFQRIVVGMLGQRPVYRALRQDGTWLGVFADDGSPIGAVTRERAIGIVADFAHSSPRHFHWVRELTDVDQWTVYPASRPFLPFEVVTSDDDAGTRYYVSGATGSVFLVTTRRTRFWAWCGAIPHWWYIRALRANTLLWRSVMITASSAGVVLSVVGILAGMLRYSPTKRYRFPSGRRSTVPHVEMKRWHYILGYSFGLVTFTWIFSGLMTMNPGHWSPGPEASLEEKQAFAGGPVRPLLFPVSFGRVLSVAHQCTNPKELELLLVNGKPYVLAREDTNRMILVRGDADGTAGCIAKLPPAEISAAALRLHSGSHILADTFLEGYDAYYYDKHFIKPLPVERIQLDDKQKTLLYVNPRSGIIEARYTEKARWERWLCNGLHSLDFAFFYYHHPLWDITVIVLSIGGLLLSETGIVLSFRYVARSIKKRRCAPPNGQPS